MRFDLSPFDIISATKNPNHYLVIGKRQSGRTTLIVDLISHFKPQPKNRICFLGNELDQKKYRTFFKMSEIYDTFPDGVDDNEIGHLINRQKAGIKNEKSLVVFDNALLESKDYVKTNLKTVFLGGGNLRISSIIGASFCGLPINIRPNIDYVFFFNNNSQGIQEFYGKYVAGSATLQEFSQLVERYCQNYSCLVLDLTIATHNISEYMFHYKVNL